MAATLNIPPRFHFTFIPHLFLQVCRRPCLSVSELCFSGAWPEPSCNPQRAHCHCCVSGHEEKTPLLTVSLQFPLPQSLPISLSSYITPASIFWLVALTFWLVSSFSGLMRNTFSSTACTAHMEPGAASSWSCTIDPVWLSLVGKSTLTLSNTPRKEAWKREKEGWGGWQIHGTALPQL